MKPIYLHGMENHIDELKRLNYKINNVSKKKPELRKELYNEFYEVAEYSSQTFTIILPEMVHGLSNIDIEPSKKNKLNMLLEKFKQDRVNLILTIEHSQKRVNEGVTIPSDQKVLSISDGDVNFLKKGERDPKIGYKPQLARSGKGFVIAIIVPRGNAGDAPSLSELSLQAFQRTGIIPEDSSGDGGYASMENRTWLLNQGVKNVSFSSSKGKAITPDHEWESERFRGLRKWRSAVEALMSQLKGIVNFGRAMKRGWDSVKAELTDKVIAFNFLRMAYLRT